MRNHNVNKVESKQIAHETSPCFCSLVVLSTNDLESAVYFIFSNNLVHLKWRFNFSKRSAVLNWYSYWQRHCYTDKIIFPSLSHNPFGPLPSSTAGGGWKRGQQQQRKVSLIERSNVPNMGKNRSRRNELVILNYLELFLHVKSTE